MAYPQSVGESDILTGSTVLIASSMSIQMIWANIIPTFAGKTAASDSNDALFFDKSL